VARRLPFSVKRKKENCPRGGRKTAEKTIIMVLLYFAT